MIQHLCGESVADNWLFDGQNAYLEVDGGTTYIVFEIFQVSPDWHWTWRQALGEKPDCTALDITMTATDLLSSTGDPPPCNLSAAVIHLESIGDMDFLGTAPNFFPQPLRFCSLCLPCGDASKTITVSIAASAIVGDYCGYSGLPCAPGGEFGSSPLDCCCDGCEATAGTTVGTKSFTVRHSLISANDPDTIALGLTLNSFDIRSKLLVTYGCSNCVWADIIEVPAGWWGGEYSHLFIHAVLNHSGGFYFWSVTFEAFAVALSDWGPPPFAAGDPAPFYVAEADWDEHSCDAGTTYQAGHSNNFCCHFDIFVAFNAPT
jgi:hypothetical protein